MFKYLAIRFFSLRFFSLRFFSLRFFSLSFFALTFIALFISSYAHADNHLTYPFADSEFEALYLRPQSEKPAPAVIYVHGAIVERGYLEVAKQGYDVRDFLHAINDLGYAAMVPLRGSVTDTEAVKGIQGALHFLQEQNEVDRDNIAIIGFSKGGRLALEALKEGSYKAAVIMSPGISGVPENLPPSLPLFLTAGRNDPAGIRAAVQAFCAEDSLARDKSKCEVNYPGDHQWFWQVRAEHWQDVEQFLARHLD